MFTGNIYNVEFQGGMFGYFIDDIIILYFFSEIKHTGCCF